MANNHRFNQNESRKISRQVRSNNIGTHIERTSHKASRTNVKFSNQRRAHKAGGSQISTVIPNTATRESGAAFNKRIKRRGLTSQAVARSRIRGVIIAVVVILLAVAIAAGVTWLVFTSSVSGKMALGDSAASAALAPAVDNQPYYVLVEGTFAAEQGPDLIVLARVDEATKQVTLISIPQLTQLMRSDGTYYSLAGTQLEGGDAQFISEVNGFAGVSISHLMKVDAQGFTQLVDDLGGVDVNLTQEVDDPKAGDIYLPAGQQTLTGEEALVACRASNYADSATQRAATQRQILMALVQKVADKQGLDQLGTIDSIASTFKTDMSFGALKGMVDAFGTMDDTTVYGTIVPGKLATDSDGTLFYVSQTSWQKTMEAVNQGADPSQKQAQTGFDPSQIKVEVRNGGGVDGSATQMQTVLQKLGFQVPTSGNADSYAYDETLVIYKDEAMAAVAESIVESLGSGRTIDVNSSYATSAIYQFDTDILVIVGKDFKPQL